ncbi:hypothetical protein BC829DRAFT_489554 [Chytridium lagenaria]|nr:hypothetical protein BC829DRAFT_489554 [Chytridium lagenaria]
MGEWGKWSHSLAEQEQDQKALGSQDSLQQEVPSSQGQRPFAVTAATLSRSEDGTKRRPSPDSLDWLGLAPQPASYPRHSPIPAALASALTPAIPDPVPAQETQVQKFGRHVVTLFLMPFVQGMFYGLGEGAARIVLFKYWGIQALGPVQRPVKQLVKRKAALSRMAKIDLLRHQGQWKELLEAAPKLRKKLPAGSALDIVSTAEAEFNLLLEGLPPFPHDLELLADLVDGSLNSAFLDRSLVSSIETTLDPILKGDESWRFQASVLKARIDLACGDYGKTIERLQAISVPASYRDQQAADYKSVMVAMYLSTLGNAHKWAKNYDRAADYFQQAKTSLPQPHNIPTAPSERLRWAAESYYGFASVSVLTNKDTAEVIESYLKFMSPFPHTFKPTHRAAILRFKMSRTLPNISIAVNLSIAATPFASTNILNPLSGVPKLSKFPQSRSGQHETISAFASDLEMYEKLVTDVLPFPRGEDISDVERLRHERVKEAYDWSLLLEIASLTDDLPATVIERHTRLIEVLYRGTKHTYQSLRLLRYLAHTFLSFILNARDSVSTTERKEALSVVRSYSYRFEKRLNETLELERKKLADRGHGAIGNVTDAAGDYEDAFAIPPCLIDDENMADAVGVLITGSKIAMLCAYGDIDTLQDSVRYAELAVTIIRNHGTWINAEDIGLAAQRALQNLALAYGELAQEVVTSEERRHLQALAIQAFRDAKQAMSSAEPAEDGSSLPDTDSYDLDYQFALQLSEIGETTEAIELAKRAITSNPSHCSSWNLLALLLTSRKDFLNALQVCDAGWKETLASKLRTKSGAESEDIQFSWDSIDAETKEEMMNFKITQLSIELFKLGPKPALDSLHSLFVLFRKCFGNLTASESDPSSDSVYRQSMDVNGGRQTPSIANIYHLQINLWLIASSLYRILGRYDEARSAVDQAETLADSLVKIETRIRESPSRIFLKEPPLAFFSPAQKKNRGQKKPLIAMPKESSTFMIKDAKYRASSKSPVKSRHSKYVPDNLTEKDLKKVLTSNGSVVLPFGRSARRLSTVTVAKSIASAMSSMANSPMAGTPESPFPTSNSSTAKPPPGALVSLINDFLLISNVDDQHMATRVHLASLYKEAGDISLAEYWYERACKRSKARGASGGCLGVASVYGGSTSHWGWESWAGFGQLLKETERFDQARECLFFAIKLERVSPIRGFDCLNRVVFM